MFDISALFLALCGIPLLFLFFPTYSTLSIAPGRGGETLLAVRLRDKGQSHFKGANYIKGFYKEEKESSQRRGGAAALYSR